MQTLDQHSCLSKLLRYNYVVVYKPTRTNKVVDALSRIVFHLISTLTLFTSSFVFLSQHF